MDSEPKKQTSWIKHLLTLGLVIACLMSGYTFYRFNNGDIFNAIFFTIGILGIILSVIRQKKP